MAALKTPTHSIFSQRTLYIYLAEQGLTIVNKYEGPDV